MLKIFFLNFWNMKSTNKVVYIFSNRNWFSLMQSIRLPLDCHPIQYYWMVLYHSSISSNGFYNSFPRHFCYTISQVPPIPDNHACMPKQVKTQLSGWSWSSSSCRLDLVALILMEILLIKPRRGCSFHTESQDVFHIYLLKVVRAVNVIWL